MQIQIKIHTVYTAPLTIFRTEVLELVHASTEFLHGFERDSSAFADDSVDILPVTGLPFPTITTTRDCVLIVTTKE